MKPALIKAITFATVLVALLSLLGGFIGTLVWAFIFTIALAPLHEYLTRKGIQKEAASAVLTIGLLLAVVIPLVFISVAVTKEIPDIAHLIESAGSKGIAAPSWLADVPGAGPYAHKWWTQHIENPVALKAFMQQLVPLNLLAAHAGMVGTEVAAKAFHGFLILLTVGISLANLSAVKFKVTSGLTILVGSKATQWLTTVVPASIRGTALGLVSVAVLESLLLGVAYSLVGAPSPSILAIATGYMALIPGGAPLSFSIVSLVLLAMGNTVGAVCLFTWGCVELFIVDKFVRPRIIGASLNLPFLAVLFGLLGGIVTLGPIGLFVGPALMALLFSSLPANTEENATLRN